MNDERIYYILSMYRVYVRHSTLWLSLNKNSINLWWLLAMKELGQALSSHVRQQMVWLYLQGRDSMPHANWYSTINHHKYNTANTHTMKSSDPLHRGSSSIRWVLVRDLAIDMHFFGVIGFLWMKYTSYNGPWTWQVPVLNIKPG